MTLTKKSSIDAILNKVKNLRSFATIRMTKLLKNQHGLAAVEFALALPMLMTMIVAGFEVSRYVQLHQKIDRAAITIADVVTQGKTVSNSDINKMMVAMDSMIAPYTFGVNGKVIISRVYKSGINAPTVTWQYNSSGGIIVSSKIGNQGAVAQIPSTFTMIDKEDVIIAEVFYKFTPVLAPETVSVNTLYKVAYLRPRLGGLESLASN